MFLDRIIVARLQTLLILLLLSSFHYHDHIVGNVVNRVGAPYTFTTITAMEKFIRFTSKRKKQAELPWATMVTGYQARFLSLSNV